MADPFPQVGNNEFTQGCELARNTLHPFFTLFYQSLNAVPDERGLTDQLLFQLTRKVAAINVDRTTPKEESISGYDYSWRFRTKNLQTNQWEKRWIFLQAKIYKPEIVSGQLLNIADFTYMYVLEAWLSEIGLTIVHIRKRGGDTLQMDLLNTTITNAKAAIPDAVVTGGYFLYGQNTVQFVPIADVLQKYALAQQNNLSPEMSNRQMSAFFMDAGEIHYNIQNILTYRPT
ncbi:hypothetical protein PHLCEN_2v8657 [Hermanssonia centrifuga]|uniref:Uncharacterized protein n=1 Tax=Hermanssonia centrifuga TaxID=98765 RepID=A0A2R6NT44_9APHY|nr:hypothetical protein PHLCEN_2v8657 [Hermanssonia centrifuga]